MRRYYFLVLLSCLYYDMKKIYMLYVYSLLGTRKKIQIKVIAYCSRRKLISLINLLIYHQTKLFPWLPCHFTPIQIYLYGNKTRFFTVSSVLHRTPCESLCVCVIAYNCTHRYTHARTRWQLHTQTHTYNYTHKHTHMYACMYAKQIMI